MNGRQDVNIPWTSLVVTGLVMLGIVLNTPSLEVGRPVRGIPAGEIPVRDAVYARLWQDPLAAVKTASGSTATTELVDAARKEFSSQERVLLVPVLLPGSPFSESEEQRIRMRYAVHAGLAFARYMPEVGNKLHYVSLPVAPGTQAMLTVPYEWFRAQAAANGARDWVLVLWLDEDALFTANRNCVAGLASALDACVRLLEVPSKAITIRVIGPDSSDSLMRLCRDLDRLREQWTRWSLWKQAIGLGDGVPSRAALEAAWDGWTGGAPLSTGTAPDAMRTAPIAESSALTGPPLPCPSLPDSPNRMLVLLEGQGPTADAGTRAGLLTPGIPAMTFYAARPTAPYEALVDALGSDRGWTRKSDAEQAGGDDRYDRFKVSVPAPIKVIRSAGDDRQLVDDLVAELHARGVLATWGDDDHCVIIRERETFFGLRIGDAFRDALRGQGIAADRVSFLGYERGLDGEVPSGGNQGTGAARTASAMTDLSSAAGAVVGTRAQERAESRGQIDYFRRAAEHLQQLGRVRVVVIVGTDVYDKLILLRAFRPVLGSAVFLTTDLDARLLHRDETAFTRNLLVASHYGLTLAGANPLPPFRDTYQTAVFDATLRALDVNEDGPLREAAEAWSLKPDLLRRWFTERTRGTYEIGRRSAHALTALKPRERTLLQPEPVLAVSGGSSAAGGARPSHEPPLVATSTAAVRSTQAPAPVPPARAYDTLWAAACIAASLAATLAAAWLAWRSRSRPTLVRWLLVRALPVAGACIAVGPWWLAAAISDATEPPAMLDGVNVTGTILLQLLAASIAAWFLVGSRGVYSELDDAVGPWRLARWGVVPFAMVGVAGVVAGSWSGFGLTVGAGDLWMVRSEPMRWAVIIAHTLALGSVASLGGIAFACCRRAVRQVDELRAKASDDPATIRNAMERAEALARGADRMAIQVSQVVMILLISMLPVFERWPVRPLDVAVPTLAGLLSLVTAGRVSAAGSSLRSHVLDRIREATTRSPEDPRLKLDLQYLSDRASAFQPIHRRLLLTTLAIPIGGISLVQLMPLLLGR